MKKAEKQLNISNLYGLMNIPIAHYYYKPTVKSADVKEWDPNGCIQNITPDERCWYYRQRA
ncbi:MAG: hypothetical protein ACI823_002855 [Chitinophagales bacterium]|jgi:hypothetical protein